MKTSLHDRLTVERWVELGIIKIAYEDSELGGAGEDGWDRWTVYTAFDPPMGEDNGRPDST